MARNAQATLDILVDAGQANTTVDNLKGKVTDLGNAGGMAGGKVIKLSDAVQGFQPKVEKAATAVSGMSSALGGMGGRAGAALGAVSNLAAAFLTGGPLLAGIAIATTAVSTLAAKWWESADAADAAALAAKKATLDEVEGAKAAVRALEDKLRAEGSKKTPLEIRLERINQELDEIRKRGDGFVRTTTRAATGLVEREIIGRRALTAEENERIKALEELKRVLAPLSEQEAKLTRQLEKQRKANRKAAEERAKAEKDAQKVGRRRGGPGQIIFEMLEKERKIKEQLRKDTIELDKAELERQKNAISAGDEIFAMLTREREQKERARKAEVAHDQQAMAIISKAARENADERKKIAADEAAFKTQVVGDYVSIATSAINTLTAHTLDVIEDAVAGQQVAFDRLAFGFLKQVGTQLMALGVKQFSEGAEIAALTKGADPSGYQLMGLGAASFAAGGAMGGAGAVGMGAVRRFGGDAGGGSGATPGGGLFGGLGFGPGDTAGAYSPDGGPARSGGENLAAGGGPTTITYVFQGSTVVGEPTTAAREVNRLQRRAENELFAPRG